MHAIGSHGDFDQAVAEQRDAIIAIKDVHKSFGVVEVLQGITLYVERGSFISLTGPSGSGKSTLLRIIASLDQPTSGQILVDGVDPSILTGSGLAVFRRERVGLIFQSFRLLPALSVLENVMAPLLPYRPAKLLREQGRATLARVGMEARASHLPGELSGGEQQRVAIARAIVANPYLLLADEPTGSLDSATGESVMDLLQELQATSATTLVVVTHDARVAARAQHLYKMEDGTLVKDV